MLFLMNPSRLALVGTTGVVVKCPSIMQCMLQVLFRHLMKVAPTKAPCLFRSELHFERMKITNGTSTLLVARRSRQREEPSTYLFTHAIVPSSTTAVLAVSLLCFVFATTSMRSLLLLAAITLFHHQLMLCTFCSSFLMFKNKRI